jgi:hypothetical protein
MSWLYSQALAEEYLGESCSDGEQSAPLNGNPIQQAYCAPDKMTDFSRLSRFGMMFNPLTEDRGRELLTLYLGGFHAKTSQPQEKAQELTENEAECGDKWRASFTKFDPDTHSWRTHQCSLLGDLDEFSETWPQWGLMRDGECWEQRMLEQTIRGTESGLSPDGVATFHTPNTTGLDGGSNSRKALKKRQEQWPTPCFPGNGGTNGKAKLKRMLMWPTPVTSDCQMRRPTEKWSGTDLVCAVWTETGGRENPTQPPALLNATWVEWLMGWPLGWTDLKPLEMDKSHYVQQQPSES